MKIKILSLLIILTLIIGLLPMSYVSAVNTATVSITANKTDVEEGDEITYTVSLQSSSLIGSATLALNIPDGLTYVNNSGTFNSTLRSAIRDKDDDNQAYFQNNNISIGIADIYGYDFSNNTEIATFKCTVDNGATGSKTVNFKNPTIADDNDTILQTIVNPATVTVTAAAILPTGISLNKPQTTIKVGNTEQLTATVSPEEATDKTVSWQSSDTSVATVDNQGVVTAHKKGTATITALTSNNFSADCTVTVTQPVTNVFIKKGDAVCHSTPVDKDSNVTLTAEVLPTDANNTNVIWTSSDDSVATVNNGVVTGHKKGTATITAKSEENNEIKATCEVTVGISLKSISLNESSVAIKKNGTFTFVVTYNPGDTDTDKTISWSSSDPNVATVDNNGKVTVHKCTGTAIITATSTADNTITASATVTAKHLDDSLTLHEANEATCKADGNYAYYTCSGCDDWYEDVTGSVKIADKNSVTIPLDTNAHDWDNGSQTKDPTCTETGIMTYTCKHDSSHTRTEPISSLGHDMTRHDAVDATCEGEGNIEYYTCSRCKKVFKDQTGSVETTLAETVISAKGHDWGDWVEITPATTETEGLETRTCKNDPSHTENRIIPKLHKHQLNKTEAVAATCKDTGNIEYWTCSICERKYKDENATEEVENVVVPIDTDAHDWNEWETTKDPTCTEKGTKHRTCKRDSSHEEFGEIDKLPHSLSKVDAVDATCESEGNIEYYTCSECHKYFSDSTATAQISLSDTVVSPKGHDWDEGQVTTPKTCTTDGLKIYTCKNDSSHTREETIPAGHEWNDWVVEKEPTVDEEGLKTRVCKLDSSHKEKVTIDRLPYEILDGDSQTFVIDESGDLKVRANGSIEKFVRLLVDNIEVAEKDYDLYSGSTVVVLHEDYLATLAPGNHTMTFEYTDGEVDAQFEVAKVETPAEGTETETEDETVVEKIVKKLSPNTGDNIIVWISIFAVATLGAILTTKFIKKKD